MTLVAGRRYDIRLEQTDRTGEAFMKLAWASPSTPAQIVPQSQLYPTAGTTRRFNDNVATYGTGWSTSSARGLGDYNDDVRYTITNGASFTYTFTGTGIDYLSERHSDQGLVDIYLDNVLRATVDTSSGARLTQQVIYSIRGLIPPSWTCGLTRCLGTLPGNRDQDAATRSRDGSAQRRLPSMDTMGATIAQDRFSVLRVYGEPYKVVAVALVDLKTGEAGLVGMRGVENSLARLMFSHDSDLYHFKQNGK